MRKILIFGAGNYGRKALTEYGEDNVLAFIDNNPAKQGEIVEGKTIYSLDEALEKWPDARVLVATVYSASLVLQLKERGIDNYEVYVDKNQAYYQTDELIFNPYEDKKAADTEAEWSDSVQMQFTKKAVYDEVEVIYENQPIFNHIEIETINRCNGTCSFCPVSKNIDPRPFAKMEWGLYESIIKQLKELNYSGRFTTFSNNEPLLDERIVEWNRYAREQLPNARMHMYTNGTLLTLDKFIELSEILDELIIDNYQQELKLIKPCKEIADYCEKHPELKKKVTIVLRKPNEILTSRGGDAPNRKDLRDYSGERCLLPFKQIIVRPTGQISLCCNDATGKYTLGDLNKKSLMEIWNGPQFQMVRKCLYEGRENWGNCKYCDTFTMG